MRLYELVLVLKTSLSETERKKLLETVKGWMKDVKILKEDAWGQKPLAYKIKRELAGYYHMFEFEIVGAIDAGMNKRLNDNESVLRHLLIRKK